jgi:hypothetical protein
VELKIVSSHRNPFHYRAKRTALFKACYKGALATIRLMIESQRDNTRSSSSLSSSSSFQVLPVKVLFIVFLLGFYAFWYFAGLNVQLGQWYAVAELVAALCYKP